MRAHHLAAIIAVLALASACPPASTSSDPSKAPACNTAASPATVRVFEGLKPQCESCHASGSRGYFASADAFQSLLVADARYVVPGNPDESELVKLLEGTSRGAFSQMPPASDSYAQLVASGAATLPMSEVRSWIKDLGAQARDASPDKDAARITRLSAQQVRRTLYQQLGLTHDDFFIPAEEFGIPMAESRGDGNYPMQGPDELPAPRQRETAERFLGLGGASIVEQARADVLPSPNFTNILVQVSQAWCRKALTKQGNTALFSDGVVAADESEEAVKGTIRRWSRHFIGVTVDDEEVADVYANIFVALRTESDVTTAYTGVCSYFIRHPLWVFY